MAHMAAKNFRRNENISKKVLIRSSIPGNERPCPLLQNDAKWWYSSTGFTLFRSPYRIIWRITYSSCAGVITYLSTVCQEGPMVKKQVKSWSRGKMKTRNTLLDKRLRVFGQHSHSLPPNWFCLISVVSGILSDSDYSDYSYSTGYPRFCYHLVINW